MHKSKREERITGTGTVDKSVVMGLLQRHGKVRAKVVKDTKRGSVQTEVRRNVEHGSEVFTDQLQSYSGLSPDYVHQVINHAEAYAKGKVHTNGLENFWSLLKRIIKGTYIHVAPFHLFRYLDEESMRFNERGGNDAERFLNVLSRIAGRRLTYEALTGKALA
jgi:transposase-like protein